MLLPPTTHIGTVVLQIASLDRSLAFYRDLLGFRELARVREEAGHVARLGVAGSDTVWLELHEAPGVERVPKGGLIGLYHFAILLPSRADLGRFTLHAVAHRIPMGSANHLVSEALYLTDPDGITVEIYRDLPRDTWKRNGEEIQLATLPLDMDGVLAAAGSHAAWDGMPAGTTIGHMHFYVGALDEADVFYHEALGFDRVMWSYPGALFVSAGGYHHHVGLNTWAAHTRRATDDDARLLSWGLVVPDREALAGMASRLRERGYPVAERPDGFTTVDAWGIQLTASLA